MFVRTCKTSRRVPHAIAAISGWDCIAMLTTLKYGESASLKVLTLVRQVRIRPRFFAFRLKISRSLISSSGESQFENSARSFGGSESKNESRASIKTSFLVALDHVRYVVWR